MTAGHCVLGRPSQTVAGALCTSPPPAALPLQSFTQPAGLSFALALPKCRWTRGCLPGPSGDAYHSRLGYWNDSQPTRPGYPSVPLLHRAEKNRRHPQISTPESAASIAPMHHHRVHEPPKALGSQPREKRLTCSQFPKRRCTWPFTMLICVGYSLAIWEGRWSYQAGGHCHQETRGEGQGIAGLIHLEVLGQQVASLHRGGNPALATGRYLSNLGLRPPSRSCCFPMEPLRPSTTCINNRSPFTH